MSDPLAQARAVRVANEQQRGDFRKECADREADRKAALEAGGAVEYLVEHLQDGPPNPHLLDGLLNCLGRIPESFFQELTTDRLLRSRENPIDNDHYFLPLADEAIRLAREASRGNPPDTGSLIAYAADETEGQALLVLLMNIVDIAYGLDRAGDEDSNEVSHGNIQEERAVAVSSPASFRDYAQEVYDRLDVLVEPGGDAIHWRGQIEVLWDMARQVGNPDHPPPPLPPVEREAHAKSAIDSILRWVRDEFGIPSKCGPPQSGSSEQPPTDKLSQALAILYKHPDWTSAKIAKAAGCSGPYLSQQPTWRAARKAIKGIGQEGNRSGQSLMPRNGTAAAITLKKYPRY